MIVTEAEGRFVTQRQDSRLAIIEAHLPEAAFIGGSEGKTNPTASLTLSAPGVNSIQVNNMAELAVPITFSQLLQMKVSLGAGISNNFSTPNMEECEVS